MTPNDDLIRAVRMYLTFFKHDPSVREIAEAYYDYHVWFKWQPSPFQAQVWASVAQLLAQQPVTEAVSL